MKNFLRVTLMTFALTTLFVIVKAQTATEEIYYHPKVRLMEMSELKTNLTRVLLGTKSWDRDNRPSSYPKNVNVFDDRFEITWKKKNSPNIFYFSFLEKCQIVILQIKNIPSSYNGYIIRAGSLTFNGEENLEYLKELADYLYFFHYQMNEKKYDSELALFEPIAAQYREMKEKPQLSEEQRKYIVQANLFNQNKDYNKAIDLYIKAIDLNQTAYPAAYSNLALLSAQIQKYDAAILNMKKYLLLEPESQDARASQDKIYEWEALLGK